MSNDADAYCEDQVRRFDRDRWLTTLFAPRAARRGLLALYAFNVEVARIRELTREPAAGLLRLQWWRETLGEISAGTARQHPVALALFESWQGTSHAGFESVLAARELDLGSRPPADMRELETYAAGSSGALTRLALRVLGVEDPVAEKAGEHVGIAWALIGLLRAVPFHAAQRRIYLPQDLLERHGTDAEALIEGRAGAGLAKVAAAVAQCAAENLTQARASRRQVPRAAIPALLPAVLVRVHLRRLARARYAIFDLRLQQPIGSTAARLAVASLLKRY